LPLILSSHPAAPPSCLSYLFLPTLVSLISFCKAARPRGSRRSGSGVGAPGGAGRGRGLAPASARVEAAVRPRRGSRRRTGLGPSPSVGVARPRARARPGSGVVAAHPLWRRYGAPPASGRPVSPPVRPDPPPPARVEGRAGGQRRLDTCAGAASARWLPQPCGRIRFHPPRPGLHPHCLRRPRPSSRRRRPHRTRQQRPAEVLFLAEVARASGTGAAALAGVRERDGRGSSGRRTRRVPVGRAMHLRPRYAARARGTATAAAVGGRGERERDRRCSNGRRTARAREGRPRQQRPEDAARASGTGDACAAEVRGARERDGHGSSGRGTRRARAGRGWA